MSSVYSFAQVTVVDVTPNDNMAGATSIHEISFNTTVDIPSDGKIRIVYPYPDFDVTTVEYALSDSIDGSLTVSHPANGVVELTRAGGTNQTAGEDEVLKLINVTNTTTSSSNNTVTVQILDNSDTLLEEGDFTTLSIVAGPLSYFTVSNPGTATAGTDFNVAVASFDVYGNAATFNGTLGISTNVTSYSPTTAAMNGTTINIANMNIEDAQAGVQITITGNGKQGTSSPFTVNPATLYQVKVIEGPSGDGIELGDRGLTADETLYLHAAGYDEFDNYIADTLVTWRSTGQLSPAINDVLAETYQFEPDYATNAGITGTIQALTGIYTSVQADETGNITVTVGDEDHVKIMDGPDGSANEVGAQGLSPGDNLNLFSSVFDSDENWISLVNSTWDLTGNIGTMDDGGASVNSVTFTADTVGEGHIGTAYSSMEDYTGKITVNSGTLDRIRIVAGVSGPGSAVNTHTMTADDEYTVHAAGYDANGYYLGDYSVTWNLTGTLAPAASTNDSWFTFKPTTATTTGTIQAQHPTSTDGETGTITVNVGSPDHIKIVDASQNEIGSLSFTTDQTQILYAGQFDADNNYISSVNVNWSLRGHIGTMTDSTNTNTLTFTATTPGTGVIFASQNILGEDATGSFKVTTGNITYIRIVEGLQGDGSELVAHTLTADQTLTVHASGYDSQWNYLGDFPVTWSSTNLDPALSGSGQSITFNPVEVRTNGRIIAQYNPSTQDQTGNITVTYGILDHFDFDSPPDFKAGNKFLLTVYAEDSDGNTVESFSQNATLSDETGTLSPTQTGTFSNGVRSDSVTVTKSTTGNSITAIRNNKSGTSNNFDVFHAKTDHFVLDDIQTSQIAGTPFNLHIEARDVYNNLVTGFDGRPVTLSDPTGTITPASSGNFSNGTRNVSVSIQKAEKDVSISVVDDSSRTGQTNLFNVEAADLHHFIVREEGLTSIGNQVSGVSFPIEVIAQDADSNRATDFSGPITLIDQTGTLEPATVTADIVDGRWVGNVTITDTLSSNWIQASGLNSLSQTVSSNSDTFAVLALPGIRILDFYPSQNSATIRQDGWQLELIVENQMGRTATLDSLNLLFQLYGQVQTDYDLAPVSGFQISNNNILGANTIDTLLVQVDTTGMNTGDVSVRADIYLTDDGTGRSLTDDALTTIRIQDSAYVSIKQILPEQSEATRGQGEFWDIQMVVKNSGGSTVLLDSTAIDTALSFSIPQNWLYTIVDKFSISNSWRLAGQSTDTLTFQVQQTGTGPSGSCLVHGIFGCTELNTDRSILESTADANWGTVLLEDSARIQITDVKNMALNLSNRHQVNTKQSFNVQVTLRNTGDDGCHDVEVNLLNTANGQSIILPNTIEIASLSGGAQTSVDFNVQAASLPDDEEIFRSSVTAIADNIDWEISENSLLDTTAVQIQKRAKLSIVDIVTSKDTVKGGQRDDWYVKLAVRNGDVSDTNTNRASLLFDTPQATDLVFVIDDKAWDDYIVTPPSQLKINQGLRLDGGETDTLVYTISSTGSYGGDLTVRANAISAKDVNVDSARVETETSNPVTVVSDPKLRILRTEIVSENVTELGNGYTNTGDEFDISVVVENGLLQTLNNLKVTCRTDGYSSFLNDSVITIPRLKLNDRDTVTFSMQASNFENLQGETFMAIISEAKLEGTNLNANVGPAIDSTTVLFIQTPAQLSLNLNVDPSDGIVTTNQQFQVSASLINSGSSTVDTTGRVRLILPDGYSLLTGTEIKTISTLKPTTWDIVTPDEATESKQIRVRMELAPTEFNTNEPAQIVGDEAQVIVETVGALLSTSLTIASPTGASDSTLSTGQQFVLKAALIENNVVESRAELVLPSGFKTKDNLTKAVSNQEVQWQIQAPDAVNSLPQAIIVKSWGKDELEPIRQINGITDTLFVLLVEKSDLYLSLSFSEEAEEGSVTLGQEFDVIATVENLGIADTAGVTEVTLASLPSGYQLANPLTSMSQTLINGETSWTLQAPNQLTKQAVNITASITNIPDDENTNTDAFVSRKEHSIAVTTVGTWVSATVHTDWDSSKGLIVPGDDDVFLMAIRFINRGEIGANSVMLHSLQFDLLDLNGNPLAPNEYFTQLKAVPLNVRKDTTFLNLSGIFGTLNAENIPQNNPLEITFNTRKDTIVAQDTSFIAVIGTVREQAQSLYFKLSIQDKSYIRATDLTHPDIPIPVWDSEQQEFYNINSDTKQILANAIFEDAEKPYLVNCPNPFGSPDKSVTTLIYYLNQDVSVSFKIFTLLGELVWFKSFEETDPQSNEGLHSGDVLWDGTNDLGHRVLNGVYILIMETGDGYIAKRKIAVVK